MEIRDATIPLIHLSGTVSQFLFQPLWIAAETTGSFMVTDCIFILRNLLLECKRDHIFKHIYFKYKKAHKEPFLFQEM